MSTYKYLVVTDLDGTLLNDRGRLSESSVAYIKELQKRKDVIFTFSTGRSWTAAEKIYNQLQVGGFISVCNGARYYNPETGVSVYNYISQNIWENILSNDDFFQNFAFGFLLTDKWVEELTPATDRKKLIQKVINEKAGVYSFKLYFVQQADEINEQDMNNKMNHVKNFDNPPDLILYNYKEHKTIDVEIQAPGADKGKAVEFFSSYYGISKHNIITLGDEINDLAAANGGSYFVAVSNALNLVKLSSKKVSEFNNNEDCVIKEIELFLRKREGLK